jgi:hypothetical protein
MKLEGSPHLPVNPVKLEDSMLQEINKMDFNFNRWMCGEASSFNGS